METFGAHQPQRTASATSAPRRKARRSAASLLVAVAGAALLMPLNTGSTLAADDDKKSAQQPARVTGGLVRRPQNAAAQQARPSNVGIRSRVPDAQPPAIRAAPAPAPRASVPAPARPSIAEPRPSISAMPQPSRSSNVGIRSRVPALQPPARTPIATPRPSAPPAAQPAAPVQRPSVIAGPQRTPPSRPSDVGIRSRVPAHRNAAPPPSAQQPSAPQPRLRPPVTAPQRQLPQRSEPQVIPGPNTSRPSDVGMRNRIPVRPSTPGAPSNPGGGSVPPPRAIDQSDYLGPQRFDRPLGHTDRGRDRDHDRWRRDWRDRDHHHWDRDHWRRDHARHWRHPHYDRPRSSFSISIGLGSPFYCPPPAYISNPFIYYSTAYCAPRYSFGYYHAPVYWYQPIHYRYPRSSISFSIGSRGKFRTHFSWLYDFRFGHVPVYPVSHCTTLVSPAVVHIVEPYPVYVGSSVVAAGSIADSGWFGAPTVTPADSGNVGVVLPPPESEYPPVQAATPRTTTAVELGHTYLQLGDGESALRVLLDHIGHYPNDTDAIRAIALAYLMLGEADSGIRQIGRAYRMSPWLAGRPIDGLLSPQDHAYMLDVATQLAIQHGEPDAWLTVAVLMQAERRASAARQAIERARAAGLQAQVVDSFLTVLPENDN